MKPLNPTASQCNAMIGTSARSTDTSGVTLHPRDLPFLPVQRREMSVLQCISRRARTNQAEMKLGWEGKKMSTHGAQSRGKRPKKQKGYDRESKASRPYHLSLTSKPPQQQEQHLPGT